MASSRAVYEQEAWKQITMPVMIVHSRNDKVTSPKATEAMIPRFASSEVTAHWLEKSNHVYFWDYDAEMVSQVTLEFLRRWDDESPRQESENPKVSLSTA
jgi:esterase/lipase